MRIGLTGGIGSGKSAVARCWERLGALIIDADISARQAVAPGTRGLSAIAERWPEAITPSGELNRTLLGQIVFADDSARLELERIVHPAVRAIALAHEAEAQPGQAIVHMVPLLYEVGYDERCDVTVVVIAPQEARIARVCARDGLSEHEVRARIARQIDPEEARRLADFAIDNVSDVAALEHAATDLWKRFLQHG